MKNNLPALKNAKKQLANLLLIGLLFGTVNVFAQSYSLKQVIVLNEGAWGGPVTVGSYNPSSKIYQDFDSIQAAYATDVIIDSTFIYVAADSLLIKYDLNTKQKLATQKISGIRELAIWNNQLLVTRAATFLLNSYFQVYDKNNLNFIYELTNLSGKAAEMKVLNDTAYIAVNDWGTMGKLALVDLKNQSLNREIDLGADGLNPETVEVEKSNGKVYTVNNLDWSNASVTKLDAATSGFQNIKLNRSSGCSGSRLYLNNVYFQTSGENKIGVFSTVGLSVFDSLEIGKSLYGIDVDPVSGYIYIGNTDFFSYGKVFIYDLFAAVVDSFDVGISPGTFAFDVRTVSGTAPVNQESGLSVRINPNPVTNNAFITFDFNERKQKVVFTLYDVLGKQVEQKQTHSGLPFILPMENLPKGVYLLKAAMEDKVVMKKIVKQ